MGSTVDQTSVRDLLESEKAAETLVREKAAEFRAGGELARTPLQLMVLLVKAIEDRDLDRAIRYLDLRYIPDEAAQFAPKDLLNALRVIWKQQNIIDPTELSDEPEGKLGDGLPDYRDLLGTLKKTNGEQVPIYLQRIPDGAGGKIWKLSNASVAEIPDLWDDLGYGPVAVWLQQHLPEYQFAGLESRQILLGLVFLVVAWYASLLVVLALMHIALRIPNGFPRAIERFCRRPMRVALFLVIFRLLMDQMALSLAARVYLDSSGLQYVAFSIVLLGSITLLRDYNMRRLERAGKAHYAALLKPFSLILKLLVLTVIGLVWADHAGYNMSTIIAGLGVGSLAVALAAQKTLENVIGAITLYTARRSIPAILPLWQHRRCRGGDRIALNLDPHAQQDHAGRAQLGFFIR